LLPAGTLLVKDRSHLAHEEFFSNHSVLTEQQKHDTADFYIFQEEVHLLGCEGCVTHASSTLPRAVCSWWLVWLLCLRQP
jgi:hypothetical protein